MRYSTQKRIQKNVDRGKAVEGSAACRDNPVNYSRRKRGGEQLQFVIRRRHVSASESRALSVCPCIIQCHISLRARFGSRDPYFRCARNRKTKLQSLSGRAIQRENLHLQKYQRTVPENLLSLLNLNIINTEITYSFSCRSIMPLELINMSVLDERF